MNGYRTVPGTAPTTAQSTAPTTAQSTASDGGVQVAQLSVRAGDTQLLHDISFQAPLGQVTGIIGPNGAGKSTLLAALCGDIAATGEISIGGVDSRHCSAQELARIRAVMLQDVGVSFEFLVWDVVAMGAFARDLDSSAADAAVAAALAATDCTHLATRDIMTLSGGERARVALARVLAQRTPIILLDEPTAALDIRHQEQVFELIASLAHDYQVAVIVIVHDLNVAGAYCDQLVCLKDGQIAAAGAVEQVYTSQILSEVYGWQISVHHHNSGLLVHPHRRHGAAVPSPYAY